MAPAITPLSRDDLLLDKFCRLTEGSVTAGLSNPDAHLISASVDAVAKDVNADTLIGSNWGNILEFTMSAVEFVEHIELNTGSQQAVGASSLASYVDSYQTGLDEATYPFKMKADFKATGPTNGYDFNAFRSELHTDTITVNLENFLSAHGNFANNAAMYVSMAATDPDLAVRPSAYGSASAAEIAGRWDTLIGQKVPGDYLTNTGVINPEYGVTFQLSVGDAEVMSVDSTPNKNIYYALESVGGPIRVNMEALPGVLQAVHIMAGIQNPGEAVDDFLSRTRATAFPPLTNDVLESVSSFNDISSTALAWTTSPTVSSCMLNSETVTGLVLGLVDTGSSSFDPGLDDGAFMEEMRRLVLDAINKGVVFGMLGQAPSGAAGAPTTTLSVQVPVKGKNSGAATENLSVSIESQTLIRFRTQAEAYAPGEANSWATYGF
jgi:hypothetical protein